MSKKHFITRLIPLSIRYPLSRIWVSYWRLLENYKVKKLPIHPSPIFILGHQKSGTTAIAALFAEMAGLSITLDLLSEIQRPTYPKVIKGEISFSKFIDLNRRQFGSAIIKEANLTLLYPYLQERFPTSKFVFIIRDPRDVIRSILNRLTLPGNLAQLDNYQWVNLPSGWNLILDGRWMGLTGSNYVEMLAQRWDWFAGIYCSNQSRFRLVKYEDFLKDKIGILRSLAFDLDLREYRDVTRQVDHQFQPRGDSQVNWFDFFGRGNLEIIEQACGDTMQNFGYPAMNERILQKD